MKKENNILKSIFAITLSLVILLPFSKEAIHFFAHHDHYHCEDHNTTHYHTHQFDCDIYQFQMSPSVTTLTPFVDIIALENYHTDLVFIKSNKEISFIPFSYLRAPPAFV